MQKDANLVELEKCCQTHILLQKFVLIQPRTSPPKNCKFCKIEIATFCKIESPPGRGQGLGEPSAVVAGPRPRRGPQRQTPRSHRGWPTECRSSSVSSVVADLPMADTFFLTAALEEYEQVSLH